jgi:hypothetical protein
VLIGVARNDPAATGGIGADDEQSAGARKSHLHRRCLGEECAVLRARIVRRRRVALLELRAKLWLEHV